MCFTTDREQMLENQIHWEGIFLDLEWWLYPEKKIKILNELNSQSPNLMLGTTAQLYM